MKPIIHALILTALLSGAASLRAGEPPAWKLDCASGAAVVQIAGGAEVLRYFTTYKLKPAADVTLARWALSGFRVRYLKVDDGVIHHPQGVVALPNPAHDKPDTMLFTKFTGPEAKEYIARRTKQGISGLQTMLGRWLAKRCGNSDNLRWIPGAFEPPGEGDPVLVMEGVNP